MATLAVTVGGAFIGAAPASAHRSPANCLVNGLDLTLGESKYVVRQGDMIRFRVGVQNTNTAFGVPCDITGATIGIHLPKADGEYDPDPNAPSETVAANKAFPSMFPFAEQGFYDWVVRLNPEVTFAFALARVRGTLHNADDRPFAGVVKDIGFQVTNPSLALDKIGSITSGQAPQNVTYTYLVTNTSRTPVPMNRVGVSDDLCTSPTYASGDNGDGLLSNGETWTFTCATLHQAPGTYTNTAKACAYSTVPGDEDRPVCSPPDTWTVTLTSPPPPPPPAPQVAVKPTTVAQAPCTLSTPSGITVRARQLNTIRVRVRNVDAGSRVTITLPGGKNVSAKTNSAGQATLRVRPPKSGRARIRVAECSEVETLRVRPARRTQARRNPRVTG